MNEEQLIEVSILERTYKVKCGPNETQELHESARYVDQYIRQLQQSRHTVSLDRLAIITALNISHELILLKKQKNHYIELMNQRINDLQQKIENFVHITEENIV